MFKVIYTLFQYHQIYVLISVTHPTAPIHTCLCFLILMFLFNCKFIFCHFLLCLKVRRSACSSLRELFILSSDFACKALNLLVDMLNDDSIAVRLQALQTMHHMAQHDHQVQEEYLNLVRSCT